MKIDYNKAISEIDKKDLEFIINFGKRSDTLAGFKCKPLLEFSYKIVKIELPELISNNKWIEIADLLFGKRLKKINANDLLSFVLWVTDQLEHIYNLEKSKLVSEPDIDLLSAGINDLNIFGELNVIDMLAGGDLLKWDLVLEIPYQNVFDKLWKMNIEKTINKNYQKIIENKQKRK